MKFCKLILHRIGQYYKTNKLVFLLFLLGGITCAITFNFFLQQHFGSGESGGQRECYLQNLCDYL